MTQTYANYHKAYRKKRQEQDLDYLPGQRRRYYDYLKSKKKWLLHWKWAKERCERINAPNYGHYGGRGIKFLLTKEEARLLWERDKADQLTQASLDRIDRNGNYESDNCRFIEHKINSGKDKKKEI
jgi:hypothetical protein